MSGNGATLPINGAAEGEGGAEAESVGVGLQGLDIGSKPGSDTLTSAAAWAAPAGTYGQGLDPRLRYKPAYWWPYRTFVKERWIGRELLEVISTEFRDRSVEYYRHALESGVTSVNGARVGPKFVLRNGDRIE